MECQCLPCRVVTKRSKHIDLTSLVVRKFLVIVRVYVSLSSRLRDLAKGASEARARGLLMVKTMESRSTPQTIVYLILR